MSARPIATAQNKIHMAARPIATPKMHMAARSIAIAISEIVLNSIFFLLVDGVQTYTFSNAEHLVSIAYRRVF